MRMEVSLSYDVFSVHFFYKLVIVLAKNGYVFDLVLEVYLVSVAHTHVSVHVLLVYGDLVELCLELLHYLRYLLAELVLVNLRGSLHFILVAFMHCISCVESAFALVSCIHETSLVH